MKLPTISVCMATYNGATYLKKQMDSILDQLSPDDEFIIADDGSTDETLAIIESYQETGANIHLIKNHRMGVIKNFESALQRATQEFIFLSDQDDYWFPEKKATLLEAFVADPTVLLLMSDLIVVDEKENVLAPSYQALRKCRTGVLHNILRNSYIGCGLAFKKELLERALPFPTKLPMHDMWLGILADSTNQARMLKEPLVYYRRHPQNVSSIQTHHNWVQRIEWRGNLVLELLKRKLRNS